MVKFPTAAFIADCPGRPAVASVTDFHRRFTQMVPTNGTELFVRVGGQGRRWCCCMDSPIPGHVGAAGSDPCHGPHRDRA